MAKLKVDNICFGGWGACFLLGLVMFLTILKSSMWTHLKINYGIGGRFQALKEQSLNIRLDLGFTNNGQSAIYFSIKEAF